MLTIDLNDEWCFNNIRIRVEDKKALSRKNSIKSIQVILRWLFGSGQFPLWLFVENSSKLSSLVLIYFNLSCRGNEFEDQLQKK